jgi:hypothetical protein
MRSFSSIVFLLAAAATIHVVVPACDPEGVGDPCTPEQEGYAHFLGFDEKEVNIESKSFQCRTRVCLVNHFRGRVSCPDGQSATGQAPAGKNACAVPGTTTPIRAADAVDSTVHAQCSDRTTDKAVYCSCRCADVNGDHPPGQSFCDCPDGFACERLVTSIGGTDEGLTGSYCIKNGTRYDPAVSCMPP